MEKHNQFLMISIGSGLVWNGLLKAFGDLPGPILNVFFDFRFFVELSYSPRKKTP